MPQYPCTCSCVSIVLSLCLIEGVQTRGKHEYEAPVYATSARGAGGCSLFSLDLDGGENKAPSFWVLRGVAALLDDTMSVHDIADRRH